MNEPIAGGAGMPLVSRGRRRRWVAAMYLCAYAVVLWVAFGGDHWSAWLAVVPMVAAATVYLKLVTPIREALTEREDGELDERQLAARNQAHSHAFRMLGVLVFGAILYGALATEIVVGSGLPVPRTIYDFGILSLVLTFLLGSLPASAAAWTEPDAHLEDEAPGEPTRGKA